ncbi:hypothetical protein PMAA_056670 [Talaromyces marneffei ATCC 18224]|uniref:BZIP domain-containing protein n=1 Tax=Talaromyces marneffei (strain ATCC 18224 / CBS 334.59 / QM 7333) TaxID=441960 RepID=B6QLA2_TALMQ|nr:hypothetical protein PMAA_056670 [Talaromyces marneffei ATCC 18224]
MNWTSTLFVRGMNHNFSMYYVLLGLANSVYNSLDIQFGQLTSYDGVPFGFPAAFEGSTGTKSVGSPESGNNSSGDADNNRMHLMESSSTDIMRMRRREQNRAAQRAYRERKEKSFKSLEEKLSKLQKRYDELAKLYTDKERTINRLNQMIMSLILEIPALRNEKEAEYS